MKLALRVRNYTPPPNTHTYYIYVVMYVYCGLVKVTIKILSLHRVLIPNRENGGPEKFHNLCGVSQ